MGGERKVLGRCECGRHDIIAVSYGDVCRGCLNYPDRCLCDPEELKRFLKIIGILQDTETVAKS